MITGPGHASFCGLEVPHDEHRHENGRDSWAGYEVCSGVPDLAPAQGVTSDPSELRALAEAASAGPWTYFETMHGDTHVIDKRGFLFEGSIAVTQYNRENAKYIAAANPQTVLGLLDRIAELEAENSRLADSEKQA